MVRSKCKLDEARFFLSRLKEEASEESAAFRYYLSAFLAAADSVIDIGRWEAKIKTRDFDSWTTQELDESDRRLLDFMTKQRNAEVHLDGTNTIIASRESPLTFYPDVEPLPLDVVLKGRLDEETSGSRGLPHCVRFWIPTPERVFQTTDEHMPPVLDTCDRYHRVLMKFLAWAEASP